jgi:HK97 family phage major capsid protein
MNIDALERDLSAKKDAIEAKLSAQMTLAEKEARVRTDEEKAELKALLDDANGIKARIDAAKNDQAQLGIIGQLTAGMNARREPVEQPKQGQRQVITASYGEQFVASDAFHFFKQGGHRTTSAWRSPSVELHATTLDTTSGSGGPLIVSDYRPGILPLLFKRLVVADLIAPGTTDSNSITYMKETTFTNAAAPVTEGAAKPESTLVFAQVNDLVQKIAHWLPVTEEMLEDVSQIRSYIDGRLRFGVALTEEDQLLNGSGTPPAIRGILNRTGLTAAQARGTDTNADAIFKQITTIATTVFVDPDGVVMNPANWQTIQLAKDANGQYYGSGPFAAAQAQTLWGLPVVRTPTIVANTALVGAFQSASQIFRKGGLRVEASNSHNDYFIKNLVAIRAEERLALAVYRPSAFGTVTGLN